MSLITLVVYAIDKRRAARNAWRIPEKTLHLLELSFGWPGAFAAQRLFRHKLHKLQFMLIFYAIVGLHVSIWAVVIWWKLKQA